jgi:AbrB family looped-hinge helix DNA binding protein
MLAYFFSRSTEIALHSPSNTMQTVIAEFSVTQKYQATIPLKVREQLNIQAGDKIIFERQDDETIIIKKCLQSRLTQEFVIA